MKHIKSFNESVEQPVNNQQSTNQQSDYNPGKGRGYSYTENLGRADNKEVYKILPEVKKLVENDMKAIITKIENATKNNQIADTDTRNIAAALGSMAYDIMG